MSDWKLPTEALEWLRFRIGTYHVVELGSGEGSPVLSALCEKLVSVEHDSAWALSCETPVIFAPIVDGWYCRKTLAEQLPKRIDALIVDGPPGAIGRYPLLQNLDLFPESVPMLIDDVHRPAERELALAISQKRKCNLSIHATKSGRGFATLGWSLP